LSNAAGRRAGEHSIDDVWLSEIKINELNQIKIRLPFGLICEKKENMSGEKNKLE
jgi:hypothetical protein